MPRPFMGNGHGIAITGSAPPDQVIVHPDDAATPSGEAIPLRGLFVPRTWGTLEVDTGQGPAFRNLALMGAVLARSTDPACQLTRDPANPGTLRSLGATRKGSNRLDDDTGRNVRIQVVTGASPTPGTTRTRGMSRANGPSRAASADAQRPGCLSGTSGARSICRAPRRPEPDCLPVANEGAERRTRHDLDTQPARVGNPGTRW